MNMTVNTRNIILDALIEINEKNDFSHIVLSGVLSKYRYLPAEDRSFISRTVLGTVERKITIDYILNLFSKVKTDKMKPVIRNILRMSVYQLIYMKGVKEFAVCNEAVKLASKRGFATLKGFVNGVLRNISREKENIAYPDRNNKTAYLSVAYSTPEWIVEKWIKEYSFETAEEMLKAQFADRPLTIRCNTLNCKKDELSERLRNQGITVNDRLCIEEALEISGYDSLDKIKEFEDGDFFVQDLSSMLVCHGAMPKKNDYIIDVCAAPGGKSLHMAEMLAGTGFVEARDVSERKTDLINENIKRLGLKNIKAVVKDARIPDADAVNKADIVIADLPCSGLGILNKKPDIKYNTSPDKCEELASLQKEILKVTSQYVKKDGILCYSTCTVNKSENEENVRWFIKEFPFETVDIKDRMPKEMHRFINDEGMMQILPDVNGNYDGFFITVLKRK